MAMESVPYVDELIREYLVFRGFTTTLKAFETDTKLDKDKGFQTKNIAQQLLTLAQNLDIQGLLQYWRYLDLRFFSRLEEKYLDTAKRLEQCLVKFCMAAAVQQKQPDRLIECFDEYAAAMVDHTEWARWFTLPYIAAPEKDPFFQIYFTPQWQDMFRLSLHNFIDTVFRHMPRPGLLNFHADYTKRQMLQSEIQQLKSQLRKLRGDLETSTMHNQAIQQKLDTVTTAHKNTTPHDKASEHSSSSAANATSTEPSLSSQHSSTDDNKAARPEQDVSDQQSVRSLASNHTIEDIPYIISSQDVFQEHTCEVMMAKFSVDGNLIASFDTDNTIK
ncbi:hypothetical protein H4R35_005028 [Dimargaris xerosporica]|nr:hypothetical protein H4R35_005028 [Dimargaris xerosporica]